MVVSEDAFRRDLGCVANDSACRKTAFW